MPTSLVDVMPTLLAAASVERAGLDLDGMDLADVADSAADSADVGRTVYSQYQRGALGVYMAVDAELKYVYSSPDRREFLFDRRQDPEELRDRAGLPFYASRLADMRRRLEAHYDDSLCEAPFEDGVWKRYPQPELASDPDAGLLIQDPAWSLPYQVIPGYSD
jgi:arylsulfatase A-like enzyme